MLGVGTGHCIIFTQRVRNRAFIQRRTTIMITITHARVHRASVLVCVRGACRRRRMTSIVCRARARDPKINIARRVSCTSYVYVHVCVCAGLVHVLTQIVELSLHARLCPRTALHTRHARRAQCVASASAWRRAFVVLFTYNSLNLSIIYIARSVHVWSAR